MITEHTAPVPVPFELLYALEHTARLYAGGLPDAEPLIKALHSHLDPAYLAGHALIAPAVLDRTEALTRAAADRRTAENDADTAAGLRARADWLAAVRIDHLGAMPKTPRTAGT